MPDLYYNSGEIPPIYYECISKVVFEKPISKLEEEYGPINSTENIFDKIPYQKYLLVQSMERVVDALIGLGLGYKEIEAFLLKNRPQDIILRFSHESPINVCDSSITAEPAGQSLFVRKITM